MADLALVSMARIRHTVRTGELISKTDAMATIRAPRAVVDGVRRRRQQPGRGSPAAAPLLAHHAWHDTRRTIAEHGSP